MCVKKRRKENKGEERGRKEKKIKENKGKKRRR